ncbi:MAG TPA: tyrosine-type recombinase/integrase [Candidatus Obscuribacterales bacterium]
MNADLLKSLYAQFVQYEAWLGKQKLSEHTKRAYKSRLNHFLVFLATATTDYSDVLHDSRARTRAVEGYKHYLLDELDASPNSINTTLSSIDHFYKFLGFETTGATREESQKGAPQALTAEELNRFLHAVQRTESSKQRLLALLLLRTGIRIGECAALNVDDVAVDQPQPTITIRSQRKNRSRIISLEESTAAALREWLTDRAYRHRKSNDRALFLNPQGKRISTAGLDLMLRKLGRQAGLQISAEVLRQTCLMTLLLSGKDVRTVARISGHKRLETTRRYCIPSITICEDVNAPSTRTNTAG